MMPLGQVAPLALRQLAAWEEIAKDWATFDGADAEFPNVVVERCASCFGGIYRKTDDLGKTYAYTDAEVLALVVAHLRLAHADLDPDR